MRTPDQILLEHALEHLLSDIDKRRELLNALHNRLAPDSESHKSASELLEGIDHHLARLRELNLSTEAQR